MAESAVSFVVQKIGDSLVQEAAFLRGVPHDITWLRGQLQWMLSFLKDAESKARTGDERIKNWIREIRDVAYEAEDTIDLVVLMIHRRHQLTRIGCIAPMRRYVLSITTELYDRHRIGTEIQALKTRISDINTSKETYGIVSLGEGGEEEVHAIDDRLNARRRMSPWLDEPMEIVGFKKEEEALVEQVLDAKTKPRRRVISIVGMGGLGKTTLARKIYSRPQVKTHFDALACVSVSQDFNAAAVLKGILKQFNFNLIQEEPVRHEMDEDEMRKKLYEYLKERRYFIILDDVWEVGAWDQLKEVFPNTNNGSSVMVTTRNSDVAKYADPSTPYHELRKLNDEESWELLCKKAFPTNDSKDLLSTEGLEELGRRLARGCGGLPLALVVLGGLLSREPTHAMWSNVADSMDWESTTDGQILFDILSLSYRDLPHHYLKSCFLYIGAFPEDTVIPVSRLIRLWIAEGFVAPKSNQVTEETARVYLDELVRRCMIEVVERGKASGRVKNIRIHDLFRDFCITEARKNGFMSVCSGSDMSLITTSSSDAIMPSYRMALHYGIDAVELATSMPKLHTILWFSNGRRSNPLFVGFKLLRVLDLESVWAVWLRHLKLPKEIEGLIHLRHLGWRRGTVKGLPSGLCNLQTLDLRGSLVDGIPDSLWNVRSLRHVHLGYYRLPFPPPSSVPSLKWLQTLCGIPAGRWIGKNLATATGLKKLGITRISSSHEEALATSLGKLDRLASLCLGRAYEGEAPKKIFDTFPNLHHLRKLKIYGRIRDFSSSSKFPPNLIKLTLFLSELKQDAITVLEKLPNLVELELLYSSYEDDRMSFSAHGFPELRFLKLSSLGRLEFWSVEAGATPRLTHLTVESCRNLEMLPEGLQHITSLQELKLLDMPEKWSSRIHEGDGEDWRTIQHVPFVQLTI